jgi:predicted ATPase/class 3 adenylate cyclase
LKPADDSRVPRDLPSGTVTFLFTDVEGSTRLLHELGAEPYAEVLAEHRRVIREACAAEGGVEVDTQGDAFFFAFPTAPGALAAASAFTEALASGPIQVRVGLHTGTPLLTEEGYVGDDVHRAARIAACGHGGQVLVSASTAPLVETELTDLGEHRLKDLSAPERVYQLGAGDFPPLKSLYRTNLPVPATAFLGREAELAQVVSLLTANDSRLLTLTGPGGTGKTRLALQAAAEASDRYPDGVYWVPLAPLRDPSLVLPTLARTLNVTEDAGTPLAETLVAHLSGKSLLLLLDNVEHLLPPAADEIAALRAANGSRLLVTSRERLRIAGEQTWPVPPLAEQDASALFLTRAQAVDPSFNPSPAVDELCARLDELPLAIELAAARTALFSTEQLLERLSQRLDLLKGERDADPRQQTLRATIEWSHDLLAEDERQLFRRLAVFVGGCTYEAAEEVAGADPDTLQSLLDKSLLRKRDSKAGPRYWMLETIREYAVEQLEASGETDSAGDRHLDYFVALAERAYEERLTAESTWSPTVSAEYDNIRAALDWAEGRSPDAEAQLASAVAPYWSMQGREAYERLAEALSRYTVGDRTRARALTWLGKVAPRAQEARARLDEALELWREAGDPLGEALALEAIGDTHHYAGEYPPARRAFERSLALREQAGAPELEGYAALAGLCELLIASGESERVEPMARELYELGSRYGNRDIQGYGLHYLADRALLAGDYAEGERRYRRALAHARSSGFVAQCPTELVGAAMSAAGQGDHARAVRLDAAANAQRAARGFAEFPDWWIKLHERHIGGARAGLTPAELEEAERAGREADFDAVLDEVVALALEETEPDA